ncbi:MAG: hypothetical protein RR282_00615 [Acinetobacter sp.]
MARPTDYREEYAEQAYNYCLLGATNDELATFFDVHVSTIYQWKLDHESFSDALKRGKEMADARVARALFSRATGYSHEDVDIKMYEGNIIETPTIKHYPPDATSMIFWLKNRQPDKWREKREVVEVDADDGEITINVRRVGKDAN